MNFIHSSRNTSFFTKSSFIKRGHLNNLSRGSYLTLGAVMIATPVYGSSGPLGLEALLALLAVFPIMFAILIPSRNETPKKSANFRRHTYD